MTIIDQIGQKIVLENTAKRIISLVPSQTELLYYLGLDHNVIGITKFCIHPTSWWKSKERIGGTKQLNLDKIKALKPDLIIANKEENDQQQIEELQREFAVYTSDIYSLGDAYLMITDIGILTNTSTKTKALKLLINKKFKTINPVDNKTVAYAIWKEPLMFAGAPTFINSMLEQCGFKNVFENERYPVSTIENLVSLEPDFLFLSSEPFPFKEKHLETYQKMLPKTTVLLVDGEMFSWYGSRLLLAASYFKNLIKSIH